MTTPSAPVRPFQKVTVTPPPATAGATVVPWAAGGALVVGWVPVAGLGCEAWEQAASTVRPPRAAVPRRKRRRAPPGRGAGPPPPPAAAPAGRSRLRAERPLTMKQIGDLVGVSQSTVSRVLSGAASTVPVAATTRARILQVVAEFGYTPNPL